MKPYNQHITVYEKGIYYLINFPGFVAGSGTGFYCIPHFLIGDAGEINMQQKAILENAVQQVIPQKTIALFLGNNILPKGMELPGNKSAQTGQNILRSQYVVCVRSKCRFILFRVTMIGTTAVRMVIRK